MHAIDKPTTRIVVGSSISPIDRTTFVVFKYACFQLKYEYVDESNLHYYVEHEIKIDLISKLW